jgi:hypothetical protein
VLISFQILNIIEPLEEVGAEPIEGSINELVAEDEINLGL